MSTGSSSLLRPSPAPLVRAAQLGILAFASATPPATAGSPAPDPSPLIGPAQPDPYPLPRAPVKPATVVRITTVPVHVQRLPVEVRQQQRPAATVAPKQAQKTPTTRHTPQKAVAVRTTHSAPELVALAYSAIDSPQHVSRRLVLALGLLVLLSASLVAGAARELAR